MLSINRPGRFSQILLSSGETIGISRIRLFNFSQPTATQKQKLWSFGAQCQLVVGIKRRFKVDRLAVNGYRVLASEVFYPILVLAEKYLGMQVEYRRVVDNKITIRTFSDVNGKLFIGPECRAVLNNQWRLNLLSSNS